LAELADAASMSNSPRRPGRPRSADAERAIIDATLELLLEQGYAAMSVEGIAARAGVSKTTIYRRWPAKQAVVAAALGTLTARIEELPDSGDLRADMLDVMRAFFASSTATVIGAAFARVVSASLDNPEFMAIFRANTIAPRRATLGEVLRRAQARGQLRPALDVELLIDMIAGWFLHQVLVVAAGQAPTLDHAEEVVTVLLEGARVEDTGNSGLTPGAPTWPLRT
jgi:AcrR family transcriptional regulator